MVGILTIRAHCSYQHIYPSTQTGRQVKLHYTESLCHWSSTPRARPDRQRGRSNVIILSHCAIGHQHLGHTDRKAGQSSLYRVSVPLVINTLAIRTGRQVKLHYTESVCHCSSTPRARPDRQVGRSNFIINTESVCHWSTPRARPDRQGGG